MSLERIYLAEPRGFCAGVERAVQVLDLVLQSYPPPIYCRKEIVHNRHVVEGFEAKGVTFIDELEEVPGDSTVVFSAHGVSPAVWSEGRKRGLEIIDATCPLVTKVHLEVKRYAGQGYTILYIGHARHEEAVGVMGESPDCVILVEDVEQAEAVEVPDCEKLVCLTQTTLSVDDTAAIVATLKRRFPEIITPAKSDICYATQNRQLAVKEMAVKADLVLVLGGTNSSNSNRLVEVSENCGTPAWLIANVAGIKPEWLEGVTSVGITSGASTPEVLVQEVVKELQTHGNPSIETVHVALEDTVFALPKSLANAS